MKRFLGMLTSNPVKYSQHSQAMPAEGKQSLAEQLEAEQAKNAAAQVEMVKFSAKYRALLIERDFWVEQGRSLQNQLSSFQRMYAGLFDQLGKGVVTEESIAENLALASEQLRAPLTTVEAVRSLIAMQDPKTQGCYTAVNNYGTDHPVQGIEQ